MGETSSRTPLELRLRFIRMRFVATLRAYGSLSSAFDKATTTVA
ncbi:MAG: hypothetical protein JWO95_1410, partial [Verrucomicrobiales bacterium]|nr:hypothetical protein [Verrucomicrobiales bacterium]